jgi:predicted O-linked N-acetylglucosamine transferase (SPINDLY family)
VNGVQVVRCPGRTISSRLAAANLTAAGLDDYIASNFDHNVELAVAKETRRRWRSSALARPHRNTEFGDPKRDMHAPWRS